ESAAGQDRSVDFVGGDHVIVWAVHFRLLDAYGARARGLESTCGTATAVAEHRPADPEQCRHAGGARGGKTGPAGSCQARPERGAVYRVLALSAAGVAGPVRFAAVHLNLRVKFVWQNMP